ncbi:MAG: SMC-Scp complex subunit ScpB [Bdellovibrionales bacterium RIFOXYD1_FULL_44_7]|nr:MAG: SMC-Scp complex subunit ScpB [Bdellovibrionales bacterium RIFOXYD1_FULL_44_7]
MTQKDTEVETALKDWLPDETPAHTPATVAFVEDPYKYSLLETAQAQNDEDYCGKQDEPEDFEAAKDDGTLDKLAKTMAEEEKRQEQEVQARLKATSFDPEKELAEQIAEDKALEEEEEAKKALELNDPELQKAMPKEVDGNLDLCELQSCIEALLFMVDQPLSVNKIRDLLGPNFSFSIFQEAVTALKDRYQSSAFGIELVEVAGGLQLRTKPGRTALVKKLAKVQPQKLSSGAMETLAIIAYKQPVMKEEMDKIRGVDSSYFLRVLLEKRLVKIAGRSELPGRPMLYATTQDFLELFGLKDLSALPSLREIEQMVPASETQNPNEEAEDPRIVEMRRLVTEMKEDKTRISYDPKEDERILKEIKERVVSIPSSTPYLDEQKQLEKQAVREGQLPLQP